MARRFLSAIKLLTGSTPPAGTVGDTFFDTDTKTIQVHDGTDWVNSSIRPTDGVAGGRVFTGNTTPSSPVSGDLWVDSDTASAANGSFVRWQISATAGQTTLSGNDSNGVALSYTAGYEQVYINGALQYRGQDYTATTGTTVVVSPALLAGDVVEVLILTNIILPAYTSYSSTAPTSPAVGQMWVDTTAIANDVSSFAISSTLTNSFRNVLINGEMEIDQRNSGASQTITAGAALAYTIDRWYGYCTGANITGQRIGGTAPNIFMYRFTGATSNTAVGFGQRIESSNSYHLAGQQVSLSAFISSSSLTSLTWTAFYANTADTFGSLASPTRTQIATGTFTISSSLDQKTATFTIPSAATTGIEIVFTGGALLGSQTLVFAAAQLELGTVVTPFERRPIGTELALCQRYYEKSYDINTVPGTATGDGAYWGDHGSHGDNTSLNLIFFKVTKRTANYTASFYTTSGTFGSWDYARSGASSTATVVLYGNGQNGMSPYISIGAAWTVAIRYGQWVVSAEL
jgi:hypothetical protein